ncbi:hypothetical protein IQ255_19375 [Pleurocapsales cyanobacterium LEGE 10410]|nr:hypothetical protein [Pleurocapsales cyanobacterium LEGE 10410]
MLSITYGFEDGVDVQTSTTNFVLNPNTNHANNSSDLIAPAVAIVRDIFLILER